MTIVFSISFIVSLLNVLMDWIKWLDCDDIGVIVRLVPGFDENLAVQGELILQDTFQVWDPKSLIRKGRDRHLFLFEISLVFSKEMKDSSGRTKYVYKNKLLVSLRPTRRQTHPWNEIFSVSKVFSLAWVWIQICFDRLQNWVLPNTLKGIRVNLLCGLDGHQHLTTKRFSR